MVKSTRPSGSFSASERTQQTRPGTGLTAEQEAEIRRRYKHEEAPDKIQLADDYNVTERDVDIALSTLRTPIKNPTRKTLNVGVEAHRAVMALRFPHEAMWETIDRLLTDYQELRKAHGRNQEEE